jgi:hypothetical protein
MKHSDYEDLIHLQLKHSRRRERSIRILKAIAYTILIAGSLSMLAWFDPPNRPATQKERALRFSGSENELQRQKAAHTK